MKILFLVEALLSKTLARHPSSRTWIISITSFAAFSYLVILAASIFSSASFSSRALASSVSRFCRSMAAFLVLFALFQKSVLSTFTFPEKPSLSTSNNSDLRLMTFTTDPGNLFDETAHIDFSVRERLLRRFEPHEARKPCRSIFWRLCRRANYDFAS